MFNRKEYYKNNREKEIERNRQWQKYNPKKRKEICKHYREINLEEIRERGKHFRKNNPEKITKYQKRWCENNPEYFNQYRKNRKKIDLKFNLNEKISTAIWQCLKGNKKRRHWEDLVGYKLTDLTKRLKSTMPKGYTWQDFLEGELHIDHKIPKSVFNFTQPEHTDFKRCWALSNLQLLPAKENKIKSNKLTKPFQPALRI